MEEGCCKTGHMFLCLKTGVVNGKGGGVLALKAFHYMPRRVTRGLDLSTPSIVFRHLGQCNGYHTFIMSLLRHWIYL